MFGKFREFNRFLTILLLSATFTFSACAYRERPLYRPGPIAVHQKNNVRNEIRTVLKDYEWIIERDEPGYIIARQTRREHTARVRIAYSNRDVRIDYLDSANLLYKIDEQGQPRIHSTYNRWVTNLERAIASRLS